MRTASWLGAACTAVALVGLAMSAPAWAHGGGHGGGGHGGGHGGGGHHGGGFGGGHHGGGFGGFSGGHHGGFGGFSGGHHGGFSGGHHLGGMPGFSGGHHAAPGGSFSARHFSAAPHHGAIGAIHHSGNSFVYRHGLGNINNFNRNLNFNNFNRNFAGYRGLGGLGYYGGWNYGRRYGLGGYGYGYSYPYGRYRYGFNPFYLGYGLSSLFYGGLGYGGLGYGGYGYGGYGYPSYGYGGYGYGYPYSGYGYGYPYSGYGYTYAPATTIVQPAAPQAAAPNDYMAQGEQDFKAGRYDAALRNWQHALVDNPQNGGLVMLMSQALFATGKFDEAAGAVQQAMSMLPEDQWGSVVSNYRELYGNPSDYKAQLKTLEAARKEKESPALEFLLGYHYGYLGYPREAVRELDKAISLNPQDQLAAKLKQIMTAKVAPTIAPEAN